MKEEYIRLLKSTKREGIENLIDWLENKSDFFTAPASTKYHLAEEGGLLKHSLNVFHLLQKECGDVLSESIIIVSLLHDICKANFYTIDYKNQKNEEGNWEKIPIYKIEDKFPLGHGEKSVIIAQKFIMLTDEEILAIRWHMGGFESKENYSSISKSFSLFKMSLLLHIADLKATYLLENN